MSELRRTRQPAGTTSGPEAPLDAAIGAVLRNDNCSGCGLCTLLDSGLTMQLNDEGYLRPVRTGPSMMAADAVGAFERACPGVRVNAMSPPESWRHPTMGPIVQVWRAWATDPEVRHMGSSGGVLTALSAWLLETGEVSRTIGARAGMTEPRRTVSVQLTTKEAVLGAAGSRYAPASNAAVAGAAEAGTAFVGKPCEVSALGALTADQAEQPLLLSFFCAGTPSQRATDSLTEQLGVPRGERIRSLWYRGRGWPGRFTVVGEHGDEVSTSYEKSWGEALGPTVQWRCKICPDGIGESADVTAADFWSTDARGYPDFTERSGVSALIARTPRGRDLVLRAMAAGVLDGAPMDIAELAAVQPLQNQRRETLLGRLIGARLAGRKVPLYRGFGLLAFALARPRQSLRMARGAYRRGRRR
ncbi:Coenzyme F420 hydrogenase/dehydrogenase, beta subunit C-terminal domain [Parafrigoribacterium soli]|uniref:Coenzyme F420 hydrogenase/dehydrogenase, beta subunit C-terminal domain n=1 Tax=Parafrigoribacterium soli TaxID=3144663 RepID=UPI0032EB4C0A